MNRYIHAQLNRMSWIIRGGRFNPDLPHPPLSGQLDADGYGLDLSRVSEDSRTAASLTAGGHTAGAQDKRAAHGSNGGTAHALREQPATAGGEGGGLVPRFVSNRVAPVTPGYENRTGLNGRPRPNGGGAAGGPQTEPPGGATPGIPAPEQQQSERASQRVQLRPLPRAPRHARHPKR